MTSPTGKHGVVNANFSSETTKGNRQGNDTFKMLTNTPSKKNSISSKAILQK